MKTNITLVGDAIENPANARTMVHAAEMFGATCCFRDTKGLAASSSAERFQTTSSVEIKALHPRRVACDNLPGAVDVYGFDAGRDFAVLMGNERRGLSHEFTSIATDRVQVPMQSRRMNCLNVAAASAVALYYLCNPKVSPLTVRKDPATRRPDILLYQPSDHFELGSTIRSAAGLGWERAFIEDSHQVWFGCNRAIRSEGRAAARRGKNEILLVPCSRQASYAYQRVTVITRQKTGAPMHRLNLAGGASQLIIIPDEIHGEYPIENWSQFGRKVEFAHILLTVTQFVYHYRLLATIALAEISRQVGRRPTAKAPAIPRPPIYDHALQQLAEAAGEIIEFKHLLKY